MDKERQIHWEKVYETKQPHEVSWTQEKPQTSLDLIRSFNLHKKANIIDISGGDSKLADYLIREGYENITVLDISSKAIDRAKHRLGKEAKKLRWIVSDIIDFEPDAAYDLWHGRGTFHFLTTNQEIKKYFQLVQQSVLGFLIISTFSDKGPTKNAVVLIPGSITNISL